MVIHVLSCIVYTYLMLRGFGLTNPSSCLHSSSHFIDGGGTALSSGSNSTSSFTSDFDPLASADVDWPPLLSSLLLAKLNVTV